MDCTFCEGVDSIPSLSMKSKEVPDMIKQYEPVILTDVPNYVNRKVTFNDFKSTFKQNTEELDDAVCRIKQTGSYEKISDFFNELTEASMVEKNISVEWYDIIQVYI